MVLLAHLGRAVVQVLRDGGRDRREDDLAQERVRRAQPVRERPRSSRRAGGALSADERFVSSGTSFVIASSPVVVAVDRDGLENAAGVGRQALHAKGDQVRQARRGAAPLLAREAEELLEVAAARSRARSPLNEGGSTRPRRREQLGDDAAAGAP